MIKVKFLYKMYKQKEIKVPKFCESEGFYTTKARSEIMSKIRSSNTKCEIKLRKAIWNLGYRYRKNLKSLPGRPDLVFTRQKVAVFVDGDFWHGYQWKKQKKEFKSNKKYWIPKIKRNMQRDKEQIKLLKAQGYIVIRLWEHEIIADFDKCVDRILTALNIR